MPETKKHFKPRIKQIPFLLGKTAGAVIAVIGFTAAIFTFTRKLDQTPSIMTYFIISISGIVIFILCDKLLKRIPPNTDAEQNSKENKLAWIIFAALAVIFILVTYIITR